MKKQNTFTKIQNAKKANEEKIIEMIRMANDNGCGWHWTMIMRLSLLNAIDRLVEEGKIKYRKAKSPRTFNKQGYWIA